MSVLRREFFEREAEAVAQALLGQLLVRKLNGRTLRLPITEVEAYAGEKDLACHASHGRTKRNAVMFQAGGVFYVYFIYGMYEMLNIVTGPEGSGQAVLIRAAGELIGPGRLTRALRITRRLNGLPAAPESGLWVEKGETVPEKRVLKMERVGVNYAGPVWSKKKYRFKITLPRLSQRQP
ncbi:MAG: DNA-3-methyladenine glycosylase [Candidatus Taylorbacteria bacterium]|nr:DNA-3-methyladenine glycosylase [Candidatus Taylorbacteria bacterium]